MTARKAPPVVPVGTRVRHSPAGWEGTVIRTPTPGYEKSSPHGVQWDHEPVGETMAVMGSRLRPIVPSQ